LLDREEEAPMATVTTHGSVSSEELREILATDEAFGELSDGAVDALARAAERVFVPAGQRLLEAGPPPEAAFIVEHGRLRTIDEHASQRAGREITLELGRGAVTALNLLVARLPTLGHVVAMRDSTVLRLPREAILRAMTAFPELITAQARAFYETAIETHVRSWEPLRPRVFTVFPADDGSAVDQFLTLFPRALSRALGAGTCIDSRRMAATLGRALTSREDFEGARRAISDWSSEQETHGTFLLLICDREATPWTHWCLDQTDRIIVSASASSTGALERLRSLVGTRTAGDTPARADLVLVHEPTVDVPQGTTRWLELPHLRRVHHVRRDRIADHERVARHVAERAVAVVLGGGGARALAEIGVLQALDEAGVPIDAIGGTSMGAVIAAAYARGWDAPQLLALFEKYMPDLKAIRDADLPLVSLLSGRKVDRALHLVFEELDLADLWLPCFSVAANINDSAMVVHERGLVWRSVRASCSLPGIFPPVDIDGRLHVDGGIVNNVPIDVMERARPGSTIIAVDVGAAGIGDVEGSKQLPTGWAQLRERISTRAAPKAPRVTITQILTATTTFGSKELLQRLVATGHADLFLEPPVQHIKLLGFDARASLHAIGYDHARKAIAAWADRPRLAKAKIETARAPEARP
jgi:predicted acylesterase/phospholipase RssA/CRP-like cAMP-binding protein